MRVKTPHSVRLTGWALTLTLVLTEVVYAQVLRGAIVPESRIHDWFRSRLVWVPVIAAVAGVLVGLAHLSRLKFPPTEININGRCQRKFGVWMVVVALAAGLWLFYDALKFPFISSSLDLSEAFNQIWLNWRTFVLLLAGLFAFALGAATTTRYAPGSRCPYALWPFRPRV
jgi:hypothetical protein